ncbi:LysR family transcriptional regulator [Caballeronia sp. TF1N1]|uniref:LysR family transcriptional regulator n=1 Tax=Caballeronia sp. TF1N1 TaxID=2878153 RepID=UPI00351CF073
MARSDSDVLRGFSTRSFSGAARQKKLEQPAVAKTVAQMAERLGARLPLRSTRGLAPAEAGQRFICTRAGPSQKRSKPSRRCAIRQTVFSEDRAWARLRVLPALKSFLDRRLDLSIDIVLDEGVDVALQVRNAPEQSPIRLGMLAAR